MPAPALVKLAPLTVPPASRVLRIHRVLSALAARATSCWIATGRSAECSVMRRAFMIGLVVAAGSVLLALSLMVHSNAKPVQLVAHLVLAIRQQVQPNVQPALQATS
jgi:hypothetical protein